MTKQLKWRLSKLPTSDEVLKLINDKVITKEEGREILFSEISEDENPPDSARVEGLKQEIKFLKEVIEKLGNRNQIIETIRYIEKPYYPQPWYIPYATWCGAIIANSTNGVMHLTSNTVQEQAAQTFTVGANITEVSFSNIIS